KSVAAARGDTLVTFDAGDIIDLSQIDANTLVRGNQAFQLLTSSDSFSGTAGELLAINTTDEEGRDVTLLQGDVTGDGVADFDIRIMGSHELNESQFIL